MKMETVKLNNEKIKETTNASPTAVKTALLLGFRQRARTATVLDKVRHELREMGEEFNEEDFQKFWKGWEAAGAGSIILGRRGKKTRFEWNYSLKDVAKVAIEGHEREIEQLVAQRSKPVKKQVTVSDKKGRRFDHPLHGSKQERLVYQVKLRPGYVAEIILPVDITAREIEKLKNCLVFPK
jgi:hypothetical protein